MKFNFGRTWLPNLEPKDASFLILEFTQEFQSVLKFYQSLGVGYYTNMGHNSRQYG